MLLLCLTLLFANAAGAQAPASGTERRLALVIGNAQYLDDVLSKPTQRSVNDANDVSRELRELGFEVTEKTNADLPAMTQAVASFLQDLSKPENSDAIAVFYFAGYGLQYKKKSHLLPIEAEASKGKAWIELKVENKELLIVEQLSQLMSASRSGGANLIILEACREDPFKDNPGLYQVEIEKLLPERTLLMFAAAPERASADRSSPAAERNSVFTKQLLNQLRLLKSGSGINLYDFSVAVKGDVTRAIPEQVPRIMARLPSTPEILLAKGGAVGAAGGGGGKDAETWNRITASAKLCEFERFRKDFPASSSFVSAALAKEQGIKNKNDEQRKILAEARAKGLFSKVLIAAMEAEIQESESPCTDNKGNNRAAAGRGLVAGFGATPALLKRPASAPARTRADGQATISTVAYAVNGQGPWRGSRHVAQVQGADERRDAGPGPKDNAGLAPAPVAAEREVIGDEVFRKTLSKARQGDVDAMYLVGLMHGRGSNAVAKDDDEMLRWLFLSSALGNGLASYKLYQHFNAKRGSLIEAVQYRQLARQQGYAGLPGLTARR